MRNLNEETDWVVKQAIADGEKLGLSGSDLEKHVRFACTCGETSKRSYEHWLKAVNQQFPKDQPRFTLKDHPFLRMP